MLSHAGPAGRHALRPCALLASHILFRESAHDFARVWAHGGRAPPPCAEARLPDSPRTKTPSPASNLPALVRPSAHPAARHHRLKCRAEELHASPFQLTALLFVGRRARWRRSKGAGTTRQRGGPAPTPAGAAAEAPPQRRRTVPLLPPVPWPDPARFPFLRALEPRRRALCGGPPCTGCARPGRAPIL